MRLTQPQAANVLNRIPKNMENTYTCSMPLNALVEAIGNKELEKSLVAKASALTGKSDNMQNDVILQWCDDMLGKGLVYQLDFNGDAPVDALVDLEVLREMAGRSVSAAGKY